MGSASCCCPWCPSSGAGRAESARARAQTEAHFLVVKTFCLHRHVASCCYPSGSAVPDESRTGSSTLFSLASAKSCQRNSWRHESCLAIVNGVVSVGARPPPSTRLGNRPGSPACPACPVQWRGVGTASHDSKVHGCLRLSRREALSPYFSTSPHCPWLRCRCCCCSSARAPAARARTSPSRAAELPGSTPNHGCGTTAPRLDGTGCARCRDASCGRSPAETCRKLVRADERLLLVRKQDRYYRCGRYTVTPSAIRHVAFT